MHFQTHHKSQAATAPVILTTEIILRIFLETISNHKIILFKIENYKNKLNILDLLSTILRNSIDCLQKPSN